MKLNIPVLFIIAAACLQSMPESARAEYHPFASKKVSLEPVIRAGEVFDSNVTYAPDNEKADFITELSAGLNVRYDGRRQKLHLYGESVQQLFIDNPDFSNNAQSGNLTYFYEITDQDRLRITDRFTHFEEARSFDDQFGQDQGRYDRWRNTFDINYTRDFTERFSILGRYGNEFNILGRDNLRDSFQNEAGIDFRYFLSSATMVSLGYEFMHRIFEKTQNRPSTSISSHGLALGGRRYLSKQLYLDGKAGLDLLDTSTSGVNPEPRFTFSVEADVDELTRVEFFKFEKRSRSRSFRDEIFEYWEISASAYRELRKRLFGAVSAFYGNGEYTESGTEDNLYGISTSLRYELSEDLQAELSYRLSITDSNEELREYLQNQVALRFTYSF